MARTTDNGKQRWTASQVVAHNLTRARDLRGLTQTEVAERLSRFTGSNWSQATVAQAEGSVSGQRVRQFTANELVALARTFDLPVLFFFLPPDDGEGRLLTDDAKAGLPWEYLLVLLLGHRDSFNVLADRTANWSQLLAQGLDIPRSDALPDPDAVLAEIAGSLRREPLLPEDVLAAVFHGLAARRIRGAPHAGDDVTTFADNLRGLADALTAFNNYRPGEFLDDRTVAAIADTRRQRDSRRKR
ncbi:MAG TPA: helix-turn-helix transcriptional regulator [Acidimicrobiales bacterium]|nr:helix-turn-helix transcriptional regulator [Acidimicrobiales bacterium]